MAITHRFKKMMPWRLLFAWRLSTWDRHLNFSTTCAEAQSQHRSLSSKQHWYPNPLPAARGVCKLSPYPSTVPTHLCLTSGFEWKQLYPKWPVLSSLYRPRQHNLKSIILNCYRIKCRDATPRGPRQRTEKGGEMEVEESKAQHPIQISLRNQRLSLMISCQNFLISGALSSFQSLV